MQFSWNPDAEGFQHPVIQTALCINCKKCEQICPVLHWENPNQDTNPPCYAVRAKDVIRKRSSSGGVFTLAARAIFKKRGIVVGAAFDKNQHLSLKISKSELGIARMRGSKYVQSDPEWVYREALAYLKKANRFSLPVVLVR